MGICTPVNLSGPDIVVKNEPGSDYGFAVGARSPSSTSTGSASSPAASGKIKLRGSLAQCHGIAPVGLKT